MFLEKCSHLLPRPSWSFFSKFLAVIFLCLLNGCGMMMHNSMTTGMTASFAFVSNTGAGSVSAFAVSTTGMLTPVSGSPFAAGAGAEFMAFDAVHKFLFVSNQNGNTVSAFSVNTSTGMLTAIAGSPFATGSRPIGIAVDSMGRFVFVANQAGNSISVFAIGAGGALSPVAGSPFAASSPYNLIVNPAGTTLFVTNFPDSQVSDLNTVSAFEIGGDGSLAAVTGSPFATANTSGFASSIGLAMDPAGKFLFVSDHMAEAVVPFSVSATGSLTAVSALPASASSCSVSCHNNPLRLAVHPNSQFAYASNVAAGTVSAFRITNGVLSPAAADMMAGQHPFGVALDPTGQFLFAVNQADNTISAFSVNMTSGALSMVSGSPFAGSLNAPADIVVVPMQ